MQKDVLFADGEALTHGDLNNLQRFLQALLADGLLNHAAPHLDLTAQPGMSEAHLYALGDSGAPYEDGSGTRTPNFLRGLVAQRIGTSVPDGNDSQVLSYYLGDDEAQVARAAVVTNPRWDVVSIKLARANADSQTRDFEDASTRVLSTASTNKQRRVSATITWTTGTESATPVEPAIPAGDVKLAAFLVTPSMTTFDSKVDIRDYRVPFGPVTTHVVRGGNWVYTGSTSVDTDGSLNLGSGDTANGVCPDWSSGKRLLAVGFCGGGSGDTVELRQSLPLQTDLVLRDFSSLSPAGAYGEFDIFTDHGAPLWGNGFSAGYAAERARPSSPTIDRPPAGLAVRYTAAATSIVRMVAFRLVG